jgi:putative endonuclease
MMVLRDVNVAPPLAPAPYFVIPAKAGISLILCYRCGMRGGWVYIMTNRARGVLYIGVTAILPSRIWQHRNGKGSAFCKRYKLTRLVYAEQHNSIHDAIAREKALKAWKREWKIELIEQSNPQWLDLWDLMNA